VPGPRPKKTGNETGGEEIKNIIVAAKEQKGRLIETKEAGRKKRRGEKNEP